MPKSTPKSKVQKKKADPIDETGRQIDNQPVIFGKGPIAVADPVKPRK